MLAEVFGYDKYSEVTSEFAIRGTYCDLAIRVESKLNALIEAKAIGLELKDAHVKQAVDYAANQGVDWVILTNSVNWRIYRVAFTKPIEHELVIDLDFLALDSKDDNALDSLFLWCKEGWQRSALGDFHAQKQTLSRFLISAAILDEGSLDATRRLLRKAFPEVKVDNEQIRAVLVNEIIKREVLEGDKAAEARRKVARVAQKEARAKAKDEHSNLETVQSSGLNTSNPVKLA